MLLIAADAKCIQAHCWISRMSGIVLAAEEVVEFSLLCTEEEGSSIEVHVCFQRLGVDVRGALEDISWSLSTGILVVSYTDGRS